MTDYQQDILKIYERSFRENWSLPALTEYGSDEIVSYGEMARRIARMHLFYKQIGLKPGDKVTPTTLNTSSTIPMPQCFSSTVPYGRLAISSRCPS